jgi:hypothetical protein
VHAAGRTGQARVTAGLKVGDDEVADLGPPSTVSVLEFCFGVDFVEYVAILLVPYIVFGLRGASAVCDSRVSAAGGQSVATKRTSKANALRIAETAWAVSQVSRYDDQSAGSVSAVQPATLVLTGCRRGNSGVCPAGTARLRPVQARREAGDGK